MDLQTLVTMSNTYGSNPDYVLVGGGNTSVKDETTLYVKGSGTQLATIKAEGFVMMDRQALNQIMKNEYPNDDTLRESMYLADVMKAVSDPDKSKRPSVEALLHNLFEYKYVLHVHPTLINGLTCGNGGEELKNELLGDDVCWIDICKPGYTLARICYEKMNEYKERTGNALKVMLLQNHGIFVSADTVEEIGKLFTGVYSKLSTCVKKYADLSEALTVKQKSAAEELTTALGHKVSCVPVKEAENFCLSYEAAAPLLRPFTPDHIVYCGAYPLFVEELSKAKEALDEFMKKEENLPRLILVKGIGAFVMEDDDSKAAKAQLLVKDAIKLAVYAQSFGGPLTMTDELIYFITHWEAEAFRSKQ